MEVVKNIFDGISVFDLIYIIITIFYLIRCSIKGFVLSLLSAAKWLLAYILTLFLFPRIKPYFEGIIENEYILDIFLGVGIFVLVIFVILFPLVITTSVPDMVAISIAFNFALIPPVPMLSELGPPIVFISLNDKS